MLLEFDDGKVQSQGLAWANLWANDAAKTGPNWPK